MGGDLRRQATAPESDPNVPASSTTAARTTYTTRLGRAVFVVDMQTGKPIAMKAFDDGTAGDDRMKFSFAAAPAVFDLDFDGYADVAYFGDLGGNLWKWVIKRPGDHAGPTGPTWMQSDWDVGAALIEGDHCELRRSKVRTARRTTTRACSSRPPARWFTARSGWPTARASGQQLDFAGYPDYGSGEQPLLRDEGHRSASRRTALPTPVDGGALRRLRGHHRTSSWRRMTTFVSTRRTPEVGLSTSTAEDGEKFVTNSVIFFGKVFTLSFMPGSDGRRPV